MESQTKTSSSVFGLVVYSQASNLGEDIGVGRQSKRSDLFGKWPVYKIHLGLLKVLRLRFSK